MRVIARVDIKNQYVIKGINLEGLRKIGDPKEIIRNYYKEKVDELLVIDCVASLYGRNNLFSFIKEITKDIFVPITLGGGIRSLKDIENALKSGVDKVAINSKALEDPNFLSEAVRQFGESTIVVNVEAKKISDNNWEVYKFCGREKTNIKIEQWINLIHEKGCGEILLTSIDSEGTESGFDIDLIKKVHDNSNKPIIVSGGCGSIEDIEKIKKSFDYTSVALASILHYKKFSVAQIKKNFK